MTIRKNERRSYEMYHHNPTELWRERQLALLSEADHRRLVRQVRGRARVSSVFASGRRMTALRRVTSLWGRTGVPFFRA
jgi:hypothetical protein